VVGDVDLTVAMDLQPVGIAVVVCEDLPRSVAGDAEDAPVRNVHAIEAARPVERRPFQERMQRRSASGARPRRVRVGDAQRFRQAREYFGSDVRRSGEHARIPDRVARARS